MDVVQVIPNRENLSQYLQMRKSMMNNYGLRLSFVIHCYYLISQMLIDSFNDLVSLQLMPALPSVSPVESNVCS